MSIASTSGGRVLGRSSEAEREDVLERVSYPRWEGRILALVILVASLIAGDQLLFRLHQMNGDALSRVLTALYMFWDGRFHLAAMSFYWSPLVSLLSIPFALVNHDFPALMKYGFAANILSACFAAVGIYYLNQILWRFGFRRWSRLVWCGLYFLNPLILLYSANGMSDGMECALIIASIAGMIEYLQDNRLVAVAKGGSWLAAAFMVRYESVPIGGLMTIGLAIAVWRYRNNLQQGIAAAVAFVFPIFCAGVIWMLLNWMIMGNPVWFAVSKYSNSSQIATGSYNSAQIVAADHHVIQTLYEVAHFSDNFWPYIIVFVIVILMQFRRAPDPIGLPIALGSLGAPLLQAALLYKHSSADWDRFFIYYIPFGTILMAYVVWRVPHVVVRKVVVALSPLVLISAGLVAWWAMHSTVWGNGETGVVAALGGKIDFTFDDLGKKMYVGDDLVAVNNFAGIAAMTQVADYINARPYLTVLVSTFSTYAAMSSFTDQHQIIFDNQPDFRAILLNPRGRANAILAVPVDAYSLGTDEIVRVYPTLWAGGVSWTRLLHTFPNGYKLYAILPDAP